MFHLLRNAPTENKQRCFHSSSEWHLKTETYSYTAGDSTNVDQSWQPASVGEQSMPLMSRLLLRYTATGGIPCSSLLVASGAHQE